MGKRMILTLVVFTTGLSSIHGDDKETKATLAKKNSLGRSFDGVPLTDLLDFIKDRYDVKYKFDDKSFQQSKQNPREIPIRLPKLPNATVDEVLTIALDRIGAEYKIQPDGALIVSAGKAKSLIQTLSPADPKTA